MKKYGVRPVGDGLLANHWQIGEVAGGYIKAFIPLVVTVDYPHTDEAEVADRIVEALRQMEERETK